ncbi:hypothetical protein I5H15_gp068 [Mycobacterium phage Blexus]|uniref:DUF7414 domain-containing protein n=1 Tax=Mycobacterium phage Blexus TaxID=2656561 RepID=A0A649VI55_9CAUD|nr:hypothetical protein I5H15_gp068 [Mycobacterium phage Blexus]QGJ91789.1 hypothetical protein SEA_BLEXUS_68 [Mycobacterium phage Blexus]
MGNPQQVHVLVDCVPPKRTDHPHIGDVQQEVRRQTCSPNVHPRSIQLDRVPLLQPRRRACAGKHPGLVAAVMYTVSGTWPHYIVTGGTEPPKCFNSTVTAVKYLEQVLQQGDTINWQVP